MSRVPFRRFITTFLLFNKNVNFIVKKLNKFGYKVSEQEVSEIFTDLKNTLPQKYRELVESRQIFNLEDKVHVEWLKTLGVFEYYDFIVRGSSKPKDPPEYFKWCEDCMWVHGYKDVMVIVNILLFNEEDFESISSIISYRYRKKIGIDALALYKKVFWDSNDMTAKEALHYCIPFRNNALIIRNLRSGGEAEMLKDREDNDGSDVPFTFHDASYIKWKLGYRNVEVPTPRDFLERVKQDSFYKYYETINMTQSIEVEEEEGSNDKIGAYNGLRIKRRNVEDQKAKLAKHWTDLYIKANNNLPSEGSNKNDFFDKMEQLELEFEEEKIARIDDMPEVLNDIKQDMNP